MLMRRLLLGIFFMGVFCSAYPGYAEVTGSLDLINRAKEHDGKLVTCQGEVIGDIMPRADHVWLHVNDGYIAVSVWAEKELVQEIKYSGDYRATGDTVEVSGIFHRSCLEHGGDLDIHAQRIILLRSGVVLKNPLTSKKAQIGLLATSAVALFYLLKMFLQSRPHLKPPG